MRRFIRTSFIALVGLAMLAGPLAPLAVAGPRSTDAPPAVGGGPSQDSWIVTLAPGASPASQAGPLARAVGGRVGHVYRYAMNGFQFRGSAQAADALRRNPRVVAVVPDYPVYLTESLPNGIERISAYDNDTPADSAYHQGYRGNGARIAIMDTGIDLDHPDLVNAIDQGLGKNCVSPALPPNDGYGHGTHVAGTAAAPLNGVGVVGVAPEARLIAVKVFDDSGNSSESLVLCGFDHVLSLNADADPSNDVDVLNMSFGEQRSWGDCSTDPLHTAVCRAFGAGIVMVAGAGNSAVNASTFVPAAFDEVIGVSALADFDATRGGLAGCGFVPDLGFIECDDTFAFFSNYGASVDVIAPGVSVYSTWMGGGYSTSSGTSMATPHVSGVAALMAALSPTPSPAAVLTLLRQSGECPNGSVSGADASCSGQGTWPDDPDGIPEPMVNALRAAQAVGSPPVPVVPGAPNLTSATGGNASVALAWSPPASDGGSPVTNYEVWRGTSSGGEVLHTTVGNVTSYTDPTVSNGTTYFYQVAAVNSVGSSPRSNELSATPEAPVPVVPGAPNLTSATGGNASVALAWSPPASDGGSPVTNYEVWRGTSAGDEVLHTTVGNVTTYTDPTVSNGTTYFYQVAAVNSVGSGPRSNERSATPLASPPVTRTGGTASNFASVSSTTGSVAFTLPAGSNRLVAMVSMYTTTVTVSSMTWKPDPADPSQDQALTFVGRRTAPANGAVEIWELADPTPGVAGSAVTHVLSASTKRVMGLHALSGVGSVGTPVGAAANSTAISVNVASEAGAMVLDVLYGNNSTTTYTAGAGQAERWDTNTTSGLNNLRGAGSEAAGATAVTMSWTANAGTNMALLGVSFNPGQGEPPPNPVVPGAPNLTSATGGNGSVALAWSPPASDGGSPVTNYEVWRGTASGGESLLTTVGNVTTFTDPTVSNGTTYFYEVAAVNSVGSGPRSNERSATPQAPPDPVVPGAPNLTSATGGNGSVALAWSPPASDGGSPVTNYEVWRGTSAGGEVLLTTVGNVTTYTDPTVSNGTTYFYQVAAVNSVGSSPRSNELSATPEAAPPTVTRTGGTVSNFASAFGSTGSVAFSLPPGSNRLVAMVSMYTTTVTVSSVTWKPDPGDPSQDQALTFVGRQTAPANGAVEIWELANPTPGVAGSAVSHVLSASTKRIMGLHALAGVGSVGTPVGAAANSTSISVNVASEAGGMVLDVLYGNNSTTGYTAGAGQAERWDTNTVDGLNNLRGAGSEEVGATSVTMSWTSGSATNMALLGVSFNPGQGEPPPNPVVPGAPNLTSATGGNGSVALAWSPPASDGGSPVTNYEVWRGTASGGESLLTTVGNVTTFTDPTVSNGTTYFYQVAAVNSVGSGPRSNERSATPQAPPDPVVPGAPNLTSATAGNGSVALAWSPPASDGGSPVTNYEVWRGESAGSESLLTTVGNVTTFTDTTVSNGTTYFYQVAAVNAVGSGPRSNERSATPQAPAPAVTRTGGTDSNFASAASTTGSVAFSLPPGSNRLVAMVSMYTTTVTVSSVTWKPDPGDPSQDQALTFVGRQTAPANGAVEIWELANPTPGVAGSAVSHVLSASTKRIMGLHALAGVGSVGTPVGASVFGTAIGVSVASTSDGLVLDVLYGNNSTTSYVAQAGQTERWDTHTKKGLNNLRGCGSEEAGAPMVTMSWTSAKVTNMALLAVTFTP